MDQISCCCFDLETTNLTGDFGIVLCGVVKPAGEEPIVFRGDRYPTWAKYRSSDSRIIKDIVAELDGYDIWVAHKPQNRGRIDRSRVSQVP